MNNINVNDLNIWHIDPESNRNFTVIKANKHVKNQTVFQDNLEKPKKWKDGWVKNKMFPPVKVYIILAQGNDSESISSQNLEIPHLRSYTLL